MSSILGWEFRLPHEKEDTLDVVGNVCVQETTNDRS